MRTLKFIVFLIIIFCFSFNSFSQNISFSPHVIDNQVDGVRGVYACDIDNDGDNDILSSSFYNHEVVWWRNDGGKPVLLTKQVIENNFNGALYIYAADVDGDNNIDVIASDVIAGEIVWWKNEGNIDVTWTKNIVANDFTSAHGVFACDINNDGHNDILGTSEGLDKISWWQNSGTNPIVWTENIIDENFEGTQSVYAIDIDNDGDNDVVGAAGVADEIALWYNNGGNPISWTKQSIDNSFNFAHWVYASDIDGDNLPDILGAAFSDNDIAWWKNEGGSPINWTKQIIDGNFSGALTVHGSDLDNDGDTDIIGTAWNADDVDWWENDGNTPISWEKHVIDGNFNGASPVFTCDIDNDGDKDIIGGADVINGSGDSAPLTWWENDLIYDETVTDYDGNTYNTVSIGNQTWLKENLKSLHYSNGTAITEVWAYNNNESYVETYGRLYTWDGAMKYSTTEGAQGACPIGWHVPSDAEWSELASFLGGYIIAGGKLKESGTSHWQSPNTGATNSSGFTALPAGEYDPPIFQLLGQYSVMWTSTQTSGIWSIFKYLAYNDRELHTNEYLKNFGYSVRCIKNPTVGIEDIENFEKNIKISPNPVEGFLSIQVSEQTDFPINISVFDISGKLMKISSIESKYTKIDVSDLPAGIFFLTIHIKGEIVTEKLLKK